MSAYLTDLDLRLLVVMQDGLPLTARPYARVAAQLGIGEDDVLERLAILQENGTISRFGVVSLTASSATGPTRWGSGMCRTIGSTTVGGAWRRCLS